MVTDNLTPAIEDPRSGDEQPADATTPIEIVLERQVLYPKQEAAIYDPARISVIEAATKTGKAQPLDALVWTPNGPVKMGEIKLGQTVCTPNGIARVVAIHPQGVQSIYRVNLSDDTWAECTLDHLWEVSGGVRACGGHTSRSAAAQAATRPRRKDFLGWPRVMSLAELLQFSPRARSRLWIRALPQPVRYQRHQCPIDPYLLGVILGDGCITGDGIAVSSGDPEIIASVQCAIPPFYYVKYLGRYDYGIKLKVPYQSLRPQQRLQYNLRALGLMGLYSHEKFIPDVYLHNSVAVRWAVLQGLMDTDGGVWNRWGQPEFSSTSQRLAEGVAELIRSLGGVARVGHAGRRSFYRKPDGTKVLCRAGYGVRIAIKNPEDCFRLPRKRALCHAKRRPIKRTLRDIVLIRRAPAQCIQLDDRVGLYLTDSHIITHNTSGCLCWLTERALEGRPGSQYWWVAPVLGTSRIAFRRLRRALDPDAVKVNESEMTVTLRVTDTTITFKGADHPDSLYGDDVHASVMDEFTRCFLAGTMVDTPSGPRAIETIRVGDVVNNATGTGFVQRVIRKTATKICSLLVEGSAIVSSHDHRYLTDAGWVEAHDLQPGQRLITQAEAVRILRDALRAPSAARSALLQPSVLPRIDQEPDRDAEVPVVRGSVSLQSDAAAQAALLQQALLSEVEGDATSSDGETPIGSDAREKPARAAALLRSELAARAGSAEEDRSAQADEEVDRAPETLNHSAGDGSLPSSPRRERNANAEAAGAALATAGASVRGGMAGDDSDARRALAARALPDRLGRPPSEVGRRGRWDFSPLAAASRARSAQRSDLAPARVDRVEILESGDPRFRALSDGEDSICLYDLAVSGHPSFSVNGLLVHNCKEDAWAALRSTLTATRGPIRLIGNLKGRRNWGYRLARKAEAGEPNMAFHRLTAADAIAAGIFPLEEYLDAKRVLPPMVFAQLYDAQAADDEGNPFGLAAIAACQIEARSKLGAVSWGWDLGKAVDYTVGTGLDLAGVEADFERHQKRPWPDTQDLILKRTAGARALVDSTGLGDVVLDNLQQAGGSNFEGYVFTQRSKQQLMEGLAASLQSRSVRYVEEAIRLELESFEYVYTKSGVHYSAPEGFNDDCVCSLALADEQRRRGGDGRGGLGGLSSRSVVPDGEIFNRVTHIRRMRAGAL